jgi:hypothetical protein
MARRIETLGNLARLTADLSIMRDASIDVRRPAWAARDRRITTEQSVTDLIIQSLSTRAQPKLLC